MTERTNTRSASDGVVERLRDQLCADDPIYTKGVTGPRSRELAALIAYAADRIAALEAGYAGLVAENERYRTMLDTISRRAALVMQMLEDDGPKVVPHLIDTDDNPGQYLRLAIEAARTALQGNQPEQSE